MKADGVREAVSKVRKGLSGKFQGSVEAAACLCAETVAGGLSFLCVTAAVQSVQYGLSISSSTPLLAPSCGFLGICAASVASCVMSRATGAVVGDFVKHRQETRGKGKFSWMAVYQRNCAEACEHFGVGGMEREKNGGQPRATGGRLKKFVSSPGFPMVLGGLLTFCVLGGRFSSLAPSNLSMPGAHSRLEASLPATFEYANDVERGILNHLGSIFGCHSCGAKKKVGQFIADHQPPLKIATGRANGFFGKVAKYTVGLFDKQWETGLVGGVLGVRQRFFPQCTSCSKLQSVAVRKGRRVLVTHLTSLRSFHGSGALVPLLRRIDSAATAAAPSPSRPPA
uniref:Uncharacterized protein n=1 Tax=Chromera velia CCMP2878 TaxID=1169474 RepID=A0A0G4F4F2_9ALVE|eukprot:Cvel_14989.t1-p1 / transcript=Cvel_14989.t1 / gene=Cvel_14989 / organism=Chromera_velia_CCMP2878 / gene_product=hypothetical protein / transcript_product=hypothetical protein / location=Cvel_scaffold1090:28281-31328(-) / protein_length=339 / sequence_SO=supercontig / SO=protein_coding / is_pseudo=false